jgi:23S rRNA (guanosine2251-2'-O)-methyltransferase
VREVLYSRQAVREALRAGRRRFFRLLLAKGLAENPVLDEIIALAQSQNVAIVQRPRREIEEVAKYHAHQGVAVEVSDYPYADVQDILHLAETRQEAPLILILDLIQDIHNLGSLIRTLEAVGGHGILIQERRAAGITPATVSTSSGATEHVLIAQVTNIAQEIEHLKENKVWIAGLEDVSEALPYNQMDLKVPLGIVVGSEGSGLRRLVRERCDWLMSLPMRGQINSLNAAIAASIVLYKVLEQRGSE